NTASARIWIWRPPAAGSGETGAHRVAPTPDARPALVQRADRVVPQTHRAGASDAHVSVGMDQRENAPSGSPVLGEQRRIPLERILAHRQEHVLPVIPGDLLVEPDAWAQLVDRHESTRREQLGPVTRPALVDVMGASL